MPEQSSLGCSSKARSPKPPDRQTSACPCDGEHGSGEEKKRRVDAPSSRLARSPTRFDPSPNVSTRSGGSAGLRRATSGVRSRAGRFEQAGRPREGRTVAAVAEGVLAAGLDARAGSETASRAHARRSRGSEGGGSCRGQSVQRRGAGSVEDGVAGADGVLQSGERGRSSEMEARERRSQHQ